MAIGVPYLVCEGAQQHTTSPPDQFSVPVATANAVTDCLVAWVTSGTSGNNIASVSDPVNGTWIAAGKPVSNGTDNGQWFILPAAQVVPTTSSIIAAFSSEFGFWTLQVWGISGLSASPLDAQPAVAQAGSGSPATTGSAASGGLTYASEIVLAGLVLPPASGGVVTWAAPFTGLAIEHITSSPYATAAYDIVSAATSVTATPSWGTASAWGISVISLAIAGDLIEADAAAIADSIKIKNKLNYADPAGVVESITISAAVPAGDQAAVTDQITIAATVPEQDTAAITETFTVLGSAPDRDAVGIADSLSVYKQDTITFTPPAAAPVVAGTRALQYVPGVPVYRPSASPAFTDYPNVPRLYLQDLPTGRWLNRDVQGITSPAVTWSLNAAGSLTVTLSPPRPDLLDATGNPLIRIWQTAAYLEEAGEIKWGGICTSATPSGPSLPLTFTEFSGYANGMAYEGPPVSQTGIDALDAVRNIWAWLQAQTGGNLGLVLDTIKSGVLLGTAVSYSPSTQLSAVAHPGDRTIHIVALPAGQAPSAWTPRARIQIGTVQGTIQSAAATTITLASPLSSLQPAGSLAGQIQPATPYTLDWWNGTDLGQEIASIQQEAPFDFREIHSWTGPDKQTVRHRLAIGVPRLGTRRTDLRFAEGENIVVPVQGTQDGSRYANNVIGTGAGTGSTMLRATAAVVDGRLRRTQIYSDQTITRPDLMAARTQRALAAVSNPDAITQVEVTDSPHARFGTFAPGDDILVIAASGWRNVRIWSRIISQQQVPGTNKMTLTLARSDSFSYVSQSGQAGTI